MEDYEHMIKGRRVVPLTNNEHADLQFKLEMLLEAMTVLKDHMEARFDEMEVKLEAVFDSIHEDSNEVVFEMDEDEEN